MAVFEKGAQGLSEIFALPAACRFFSGFNLAFTIIDDPFVMGAQGQNQSERRCFTVKELVSQRAENFDNATSYRTREMRKFSHRNAISATASSNAQQLRLRMHRNQRRRALNQTLPATDVVRSHLKQFYRADRIFKSRHRLILGDDRDKSARLREVHLNDSREFDTLPIRQHVQQGPGRVTGA